MGIPKLENSKTGIRWAFPLTTTHDEEFSSQQATVLLRSLVDAKQGLTEFVAIYEMIWTTHFQQ